jgi:hypothetical protein
VKTLAAIVEAILNHTQKDGFRLKDIVSEIATSDLMTSR